MLMVRPEHGGGGVIPSQHVLTGKADVETQMGSTHIQVGNSNCTQQALLDQYTSPLAKFHLYKVTVPHQHKHMVMLVVGHHDLIYVKVRKWAGILI